MNYFYVNNLKVNHIENNQNIIDYLENIGILIPHYCYHRDLSVSGNCRMCLIELKNSPKPLVSCAMTVTNKMEFYTDSPLVKKARENVLEFLLLNHPLDCPVCDQGGECDLQDQSMVFGISRKRFFKYKRSVANKNIGPIVKTIMTRCIHCTRCVRFSSEIAGVDDLGTFNRGNSMEIGTYVSKTFQSELSGNIIDLCPVGALTSKPYSFVDRVWELELLESIDFADGFGLSTEISLKNSLTVTKVSANTKKSCYEYAWISDKTRFSFDGMFSPERLSNVLSTSTGSAEKVNTVMSWGLLFKQLSDTLYFKDHLSRQLKDSFTLTIIFSPFISAENLISLVLLCRKFPFFNIVRLSNSLIRNDFVEDFITQNASNSRILETSDLCILVGVNTRYEGFNLNLALRQRFLKGNFQVFSLNSMIDFTFPAHVIGADIKHLRDITEGNHFLGSRLKNAKNPLIVCGSSLFTRKDSQFTQSLLKYVYQNSQLSYNGSTVKSKKWNGLNILNTSLNETGVSNLTPLSSFCSKIFRKTDGLYFINASSKDPVLLKLIELKSLGYLNKNKHYHKLILTQASVPNDSFTMLQNLYSSYSRFNMPSTTFYETSGTYTNTEGFTEKTVNIVSSQYLNKDGWQINRQLSSVLGEISFLSNLRYSQNIAYVFNNTFFLTLYTNLTLNPTKSYTQAYSSNISACMNKTFSVNKLIKIKLSGTKVTQWLDDFYLSGKDPYSKISRVMIKCSQMLRKNSVTFKHLL